MWIKLGFSSSFGQAFVSVSPTKNHACEFQRYKITQQAEYTNFTSNNEGSYVAPSSEETFHHTPTKTNETGPGHDKITYSIIKID